MKYSFPIVAYAVLVTTFVACEKKEASKSEPAGQPTETTPAAPASPTKVLEERWTATSTSAMSITGDLTISPTELRFGDGNKLTLAKPLKIDNFIDGDVPVGASVYRISEPANLVLKNGNRLCGSAKHEKSVTYIALWRPGTAKATASERAFAAYSGDQAPKASQENGVCGIFYYELATK